MNIQITFEKDHYQERAKKLLSNLLLSELLSINPYSVDDDGLDVFFKNRSKGYMQPQSFTDELEIAAYNFCTIGKTNGHTTNEYNGWNYNKALISFGEGKTLDINYRHFCCDMKPIDNKLEGGWTHPVVNDRFVHCSISGTRETIDNIFHIADYKQILYAYSFLVYNDYGKYRICYRFFALFGNEADYHDILRKQILKSQYFVLNHILRHTSLYAPQTRQYISGVAGDWAVWSEPARFFVEIFDKYFRNLFKNKLQAIEKIMAIKNIVPTDDF